MLREPAQDPPELDKDAYEEYYKTFDQWLTSNAMSYLQDNRLPLKYDQDVYENDIDVAISNITVTKVKEVSDTYEFSVEYGECPDERYSEKTISGRLTCVQEEGKLLIDSMTIVP